MKLTNCLNKKIVQGRQGLGLALVSLFSLSLSHLAAYFIIIQDHPVEVMVLQYFLKRKLVVLYLLYLDLFSSFEAEPV